MFCKYAIPGPYGNVVLIHQLYWFSKKMTCISRCPGWRDPKAGLTKLPPQWFNGFVPFRSTSTQPSQWWQVFFFTSCVANGGLSQSKSKRLPPSFLKARMLCAHAGKKPWLWLTFCIHSQHCSESAWRRCALANAIPRTVRPRSPHTACWGNLLTNSPKPRLWLIGQL